MTIPPFHLAFPVRDIEVTRVFYQDIIGCSVGREDLRWIDFDFFGHQISAHVVDGPEEPAPTNTVDGKQVPVRHFGAILGRAEWDALADRFRRSDVRFLIEPYVRWAGKPEEQATMFVLDPSGNGLEFKSFRSPDAVWAVS